MDKHTIDTVINCLGKRIVTIISADEYAEDCSSIAELTTALAELVSARAELEKGQLIITF